MIEAAMREVGAARSIVIDETGTVLAGNATIEAAAAAGIARVKVVDADGEEIVAVRRTGLTAKQKTRLALYDNRAAELAEWDDGALGAIGNDLVGLFSDDELGALLSFPELEEVDSSDDPDSARLKKSGTSVAVVLDVAEVSLVERAIAATGEINRGAALLAICRKFLGEEG